MAAKTAQRVGYGRLLEAWSPPAGAGEPVGCAATSFTFSPVFFEEECLARFLHLDSDPTEDGPVYLVEREEKLAQLACAAALVDQHHCRGTRSLRWDLLSARVPRGILHAKISLLVWTNRIRLIVASANLTEDGYRRNQEVYGVLDYHEGSAAPLPCLRDFVAFLREAAEYSRAARAPALPALARWNRLLDRAGDVPPDWGRGRDRFDRRSVNVRPVLVGPGRGSVFEALSGVRIDGAPPHSAVVVSPFFDDDGPRNLPAEFLWRQLRRRGAAHVDYLTTAEDVPGSEEVRIHLPASVVEAQPSGRPGLETRFQRFSADDEGPRSLHAKGIWLESDTRVLYLMGSSNFTTAGLGLGGSPNLEANLVYAVDPREDRDGYGALLGARLAGEPLDEASLTFQANSAEGEDAPAEEVVLPRAFAAVVYDWDVQQGPRLTLSLEGEPPSGWRVLRERETDVLVDESAWLRKGRPESFVVGWHWDRPPSALRVGWDDAAELAWWPVNIASSASLPPPPELKDLPLEVLIEILTSARPLHRVLRPLLRRKQAVGEPGAPDPGLIADPHQKVDTSRFLLQRTRRVSWALNALRDRLERPVATRASLDWRLRGPVGAAALAKALVREARSDAERAFLLCELALELNRARPRYVPGGVPADEVRSALRTFACELRDRMPLAALNDVPNLRRYVETVFQRGCVSFRHPLSSDIGLHVEGRIAEEDATRQERTAREILRRLEHQPGIVLADEVGMGKTFVALAVAVSVVENDAGRRPVVVMVPPSLKEKWPADFELFRERCLPEDLAARVRCGWAERAVQFLKLLDDPPSRRKSILFVTHGALSRGLVDRWVMLAIVQWAIKGRRDASVLRRQVARFAGDLLNLKWAQRNGDGIWRDLLATAPVNWLRVFRAWEIDPEGRGDPSNADDPVPEAVLKVLPELDTSAVLEALRNLPKRRSKYLQERLRVLRKTLRTEIRALWQQCIPRLRLSLPLLILDEAHHLKNAHTRLASLFRVPEARDDMDELTRGALGGVFERMVFLTATPFQLGHAELCNVLERFNGINWRGSAAPDGGRDGFQNELRQLRAALDAAQNAAVSLDYAWGRLTLNDLIVDAVPFGDVGDWWHAAEEGGELTSAGGQVLDAYSRTRSRMRAAEARLKLWTIRHLKPRELPAPHLGVARRDRRPGRAILPGAQVGQSVDGLSVSVDALLPFLLAARATSHNPKARPVFAEGLASSYEAFLETRAFRANGGGGTAAVIDLDDDPADGEPLGDGTDWYLGQLERLVPSGDLQAAAAHPKMAATIARVTDAWRRGEKVVVFCHYVATGRALRRVLSEAVAAEVRRLGGAKLACQPGEVAAKLERFGERFFDADSPIRRACDAETSKLLQGYPALGDYEEALLDIVRRNLRTPSFLVRFFPLEQDRLDEASLAEAMASTDGSGLTLRHLLHHFFRFLVERCGEEDRRQYIEAVDRIQTGLYRGADAYAPDELQNEKPELLHPNVRLVNGSTRSETRRRLMLTFNTPFYPEVLIASSVMAEGVDLHLNCRYVIHHDLCWNPSTLEQRTGRVDRIGAKAERVGRSIHVYLPYIAETQDEKMYRVVTDRERWFNVVMGEAYQVDAWTTDKLAARLPLPQAVAESLAFRLEVRSDERP